MKKIIFATTLLALSSLANANGNVAMVKKLYTPSGLNNSDSLLKKMSTPKLKSALNCVDYDVVTQAQDFDDNEVAHTARFTALQNGNVKVNFSNFGQSNSVTYKFSCKSGKCLIDDVVGSSGSAKSCR